MRKSKSGPRGSGLQNNSFNSIIFLPHYFSRYFFGGKLITGEVKLCVGWVFRYCFSRVIWCNLPTHSDKHTALTPLGSVLSVAYTPACPGLSSVV